MLREFPHDPRKSLQQKQSGIPLYPWIQNTLFDLNLEPPNPDTHHSHYTSFPNLFLVTGLVNRKEGGGSESRVLWSPFRRQGVRLLVFKEETYLIYRDPWFEGVCL